MSITDAVPLPFVLLLAGALFCIGMFGALTRRNAVRVLLGVELMLNAVNLSFVAFASRLNDVNGQVAVFFTLVVAAAEVVVGLGIVVAIFRRRKGSATADDIHILSG